MRKGEIAVGAAIAGSLAFGGSEGANVYSSNIAPQPGHELALEQMQSDNAYYFELRADDQTLHYVVDYFDSEGSIYIVNRNAGVGVQSVREIYRAAKQVCDVKDVEVERHGRDYRSFSLTVADETCVYALRESE